MGVLSDPIYRPLSRKALVAPSSTNLLLSSLVTFIEYQEGDRIGFFLAWFSMLPFIYIVSLCTLILFRRDIQTVSDQVRWPSIALQCLLSIRLCISVDFVSRKLVIIFSNEFSNKHVPKEVSSDPSTAVVSSDSACIYILIHSIEVSRRSERFWFRNQADGLAEYDYSWIRPCPCRKFTLSSSGEIRRRRTADGSIRSHPQNRVSFVFDVLWTLH